MRHVVTPLVVAAALLLPMLSAPAAAEEPMAHMVQIDVGDWWEYRLTGRDDGTVRNEVMAKGTHHGYFGETSETYRIRGTGDVNSQQSPYNTGLGTPGIPVHVTFDSNKWVHTSDYGTVGVWGNTTVDTGSAVEVREAFNPPLIDTVFDFGVDWRWKSRAVWHYEREASPQQPDGEVDQTAHVEAYETITVEAGTFQAWRINLTSYKLSNAFTLQWYSEAACTVIKEERYDDDGGTRLINTLELTDYSCDGDIMERPTYDPQWVTLLSRGQPLPTDWTEPPSDPDQVNNRSPGIGGFAVVAGIALAVVVMALEARRRRG